MKPAHEQPGLRIYQGHVLDVLRQLRRKSVNSCVTSPPYWGLRDYGLPASIWGGDPLCQHEFGEEIVDRSRATPGVNGSTLTGGGDYQASAMRFESRSAFCQRCGAWRGCFGLEPTPDLYVQHSVEIFREVREVLTDDGTLWLNLGDSYATGAGKVGDHPGGAQGRAFRDKYWGKHSDIGLPQMTQPNRLPIPGLKPKDLVGIPWRVALALQADGWYLRSDIIWAKPNPMPESITDRPTKSHEYLFLLSKSEQYYFDADAIAEPATTGKEAKYDNGKNGLCGGVSYAGTGTSTRKFKTNGSRRNSFARATKYTDADHGQKPQHRPDRENVDYAGITRNARSVWTIDDERAFLDWMIGQPDGPALLDRFLSESSNAKDVWSISTRPYPGAHFAVFPPELPRRCILAGTPPDGVVMDCFHGSGTTMQEARELGRSYVGIEQNPEYIELSKDRVRQEMLFAPASVPSAEEEGTDAA